MIVKTCTCCKREFTLAAWRTLKFVGFMETSPFEKLELRNCDCKIKGSSPTLAIKIDANGDHLENRDPR